MRLTRIFAAAFGALLVAVPVTARGQGANGWVGVVITTGIGTVGESGAMTFTDYPTIESIDPGSPAEKAGLQAGDVLISINAQDFRKNPIPMSSLLVPGQRIVFRYRRNDLAKTATLMVVERPMDMRAYVEFHRIGPAPERMAVATKRRTEALLNRNVAIGSPREPLISIAPLVIGSGSPTLRVVGAELTQLNADLRDVLKVKGEGVFVINVAMGTPAGEAGLKSGDVIVEAGKERLENPGELIRLMRAAADNSLMLRIVRKQKPQTLTLRW
ncbi:MAG TPA: PDZ domain-containing protein [Gemmatimonadaceae bacterium]|nr:PDZ domain-containing protein [Gemmatimonadaceae bacterium]